jgi:hypothetical protein
MTTKELVVKLSELDDKLNILSRQLRVVNSNNDSIFEEFEVEVIKVRRAQTQVQEMLQKIVDVILDNIAHIGFERTESEDEADIHRIVCSVLGRDEIRGESRKK